MNVRLAPTALLIWFGFLATAKSQQLACLWINGTSIDGHLVKFEGESPSRKLAQVITSTPESFPQLFADHRYDPDDPIASKNDVAVRLLLKGDAPASVKMLNDIEREAPGAYFTAANLGTAYELSGDDELALRWIKEGIRRNPASHMETEWLHARILEAKIEMKKSGRRAFTSAISGIPLDGDVPDGWSIETLQGTKPASDVHRALEKQLSVRMLFVKPTDPIVAQLLLELAILESRVRVLEEAIGLLDLAVQYGKSDAGIARYKTQWQPTVRWGDFLRRLRFGGWIMVMFAAPLLAVYLLRRIRRNRSSNA